MFVENFNDVLGVPMIICRFFKVLLRLFYGNFNSVSSVFLRMFEECFLAAS